MVGPPKLAMQKIVSRCVVGPHNLEIAVDVNYWLKCLKWIKAYVVHYAMGSLVLGYGTLGLGNRGLETEIDNPRLGIEELNEGM